MTSPLENRISMYYKIREFFSNNLSTLEATAPALTANVGSFNTQLDALDALMITADENSSGYATQKQNYRTTMQESALAISGALYALGKITNNEPLAAKAYATRSGLNAKRDTDVLYFCERLKTITDDNAAALVPMGVDAAKITALGTAITAYKEAIQDPADKRGKGKAARIEADKKTNEIDNTLQVTDAVMLAVSNDHSLLYQQYRANRLIDDNASGTSQPDVIEVIEAGSIETLYEVPYLASRSFKLKNTHPEEAIKWALSEDGTTPMGEWKTLQANTSSTIQSPTLGETGDRLIVNNESTKNITVELSVIE